MGFARVVLHLTVRFCPAWYGNEPGLSAYSQVSDQYAPDSTQIIPATAHEAPYILDGLLQNDTGRQIREHYVDTGGFTDHVFAICSVLGFRFAPRIRDLPDKRLYAPAPDHVPPALQPLIGGRINIRLIRENWPDILRLAASMAAGTVVPSQILRKLAAYPRQNSLALALREVGRLERSIFMLDWLGDIDLQRRAQIGLNKGEAHHALKRAVSFNRRGEIRDRSSEGQQHRIAGLNLLTAIIIYWNSWKRGEIAATALYQWMGKQNLQPRVTLNGSSADRIMRVIHNLEQRNRLLQEENAHLRKFLGKKRARQVEQLQRATAGGLLDDFIQAVKGMYSPLPLEIPRGAAKEIAGVLGLSETTARQMLRGRRKVGSEEIARIRSAPRISAPRKAKRRKKSRASKPKLGQIELTGLNGRVMGA